MIRITNYSYAIARLVGLTASSGALGLIICMAWRSDAHWWMRVFAVVFVGLLMVLCLLACLRAVLWMELSEDALHVRRIFTLTRYSWDEVTAVWAGVERTYIKPGLPFMEYRALYIRARDGQFKTLVRARDLEALRKLGAFRERFVDDRLT